MPSNKARAERWMQRALDPDVSPLAANGNVYSEGDTIFSYGSHFPMAIVMRERENTGHYGRSLNSPTVGKPRWVLVNGDRYSVTTSGHQSMVRSVIADSGLPYVIIPFTALRAAGIEQHTIEILEARPDRSEDTDHSSAEMPTGDIAQRWDSAKKEMIEDNWVRYLTPRSNITAMFDPFDNLWKWTTSRHFLGDSVFRAKANGRRRRFLSSFDYQEAQPLYFLCELPRSSKAETVEQAYEDLKPPRVKAAEAQLRTVSRQGDMFAIPTTFTTREVKEMTPHGKGRIVKRPKLGLLGTNHRASEVIFATGGRIYARGLLYHQPGRWRTPDHARRKMGDGKTWHLLVKNTVPTETVKPRERTPA